MKMATGSSDLAKFQWNDKPFGASDGPQLPLRRDRLLFFDYLLNNEYFLNFLIYH